MSNQLKESLKMEKEQTWKSLKVLVRLDFKEEEGTEFVESDIKKMIKQACREQLHCKVKILEVEGESRAQFLNDTEVLLRAKKINPYLVEPTCGQCGQDYSLCECK